MPCEKDLCYKLSRNASQNQSLSQIANGGGQPPPSSGLHFQQRLSGLPQTRQSRATGSLGRRSKPWKTFGMEVLVIWMTAMLKVAV
jgi:hypothetical protein